MPHAVRRWPNEDHGTDSRVYPRLKCPVFMSRRCANSAHISEVVPHGRGTFSSHLTCLMFCHAYRCAVLGLDPSTCSMPHIYLSSVSPPIYLIYLGRLQGILEKGRGYRDAEGSTTTPSGSSSCNNVAQLEVGAPRGISRGLPGQYGRFWPLGRAPGSPK